MALASSKKHIVGTGTETVTDKKSAEINVEYGVGSVFPGAQWSDWHDDRTMILNKPVVNLDQLTEMRRRDGQAKALIQLVTLPLRTALQSGEWIEPDEGDAEAETEFANQMWTLPPMAGGMTTPRSKLVRQMVLAVVDGFSAFEIVRQIPENGPLAGKVTLRKLAYRDPNTIRFNVDETGGYAGFRQTAYNGRQILIDKDFEALKTLTITCSDELNPYYGVSLFESAYPHFDAKRKLYYIAHLAAQFAAVPGRVGKVPPGARPAEVIAFREALKNFAFNTAMIAPPDYEVEAFNGNSSFDFLKLIEHHNSQMSKSVLAPFFDQDQRPVLIENTTQDASADLFLSCMESIAEDIAEALTNYMMPQFIDYNFDSKKYPVFRPGKLSDSAKSLIRDMFATTVVSGIINSTPEFIRELEIKVAGQMNLDIDYDEIAAKEQEAAKKAEEQAQQQAEQDAAMQAAQQPAAQAPVGNAVGALGKVVGPPKVPAVTKPGVKGGTAKLSAEDMTKDIDELVKAAQELFTYGADYEDGEVDDIEVV